MCGIFGQIGTALSPEQTARVIAVLRHRGPETQAAKHLPDASLVHTRLRIIDLSPAGSQPMCNEDETVWVTFNGELYNFLQLRRELEQRGHVFRSRSDTEVLVHGYEEWGDAIVARVHGMFAFGIWDVRRKRLLLARDRCGKKPLFYTQSTAGFSFASEIKAFAAAGNRLDINPQGLGFFLSYGYVPPSASLYQGILQLPPATMLTWELGQTPVLHRYWRLPESDEESHVSENEAAEQTRTLLEAAVSRRLIADVPLGAFLSGGVDSSIVVGLMVKKQGGAKTFSIGFQGDPRYDETAFARIAAKHFGTEHTEFMVGPEAFSLVEKLVWQHDGPFGDSSAVPTYVVSQLTRQHVTVALSGDGGDELFAGYLRFFAAGLSEMIPSPLRAVGGSIAAKIPAYFSERSLLARARRFMSAAKLPLADRIVFWNSFFALSLGQLLQPAYEAQISTEEILQFSRAFFVNPKRSVLSRALQHNFETYLPYDLLVKADRTSMAHALELRSPFLDTALVEFAARLPDRFKLRGRETKYILRKAFADLLPREIMTRGKMGFGMPLATWFRGELREYLTERLLPRTARLYEYLRPEVVQTLLQDHLSGNSDYSHQLWALLTMEIWLQQRERLREPWQDVSTTEAYGA